MDQDQQAAAGPPETKELPGVENHRIDLSETPRENIADEEDSTLYWAEVEAIAKDLFKMWWDGSEREWAKIAWEHIVAAGYANGEHGTEFCHARLRFLALATLYADWCSLATEEEPEPEVQSYVEILGLNPFYLGLMLEPDYELDGQDHYGFYDDELALANAVRELVRRERPTVSKALLAGFGSPSELFVSLWRTRYPVIEQSEEQEDASHDTTEAAISSGVGAESGERLQLLIELSDPEDDDEEEEYDEAMLSDEEVLNDVTAEKLEAWEWINEGCPALK